MEGVPSRLFASGPSRKPPLDGLLSHRTLVDLYAFPTANTPPTTEGLAANRPIIENLDVPSGRPDEYTLATDALGRLLFVQFNPATPPSQASPFEVRRFDSASGSVTFLSYADLLSGDAPFLLSPHRTRVFAGAGGTGHLFEQDSAQTLWDVWDATFIGEDLYCAGVLTAPDPTLAPSGSNVIRVQPNAQPEVLLSSTGQLGFVPILGDQTPQLLLSLDTDLGNAPFALLDTISLASTPLPPEKGQAQFVSASSDGHWLLFSTTIPATDTTQAAEYRLFLFDWTTDATTALDSTRLARPLGTHREWRPGSSELWLSTDPSGLLILAPKSYLLEAPISQVFQTPPYWPSSFTRDGRHWFSTDGDSPPAIFVGAADNPGGQVLRLNPGGGQVSPPWETDDGYLLVETSLVDSRRSDISLVDPVNGTSRPIAGNGHLVAVGQTRALALLNFDLARLVGDLTLIDFASGSRIFLAGDVYAVAVDRGASAMVPSGTAPLVAGTRIAFLTRNRLASPYDGLWVAELP